MTDFLLPLVKHTLANLRQRTNKKHFRTVCVSTSLWPKKPGRRRSCESRAWERKFGLNPRPKPRKKRLRESDLETSGETRCSSPKTATHNSRKAGIAKKGMPQALNLHYPEIWKLTIKSRKLCSEKAILDRKKSGTDVNAVILRR